MSRALNKLTARQVDLFHKSTLPEGKSKDRISDGGNLYLIKRESSSSWYFYFNHQGRRREFRIGAYPAISLANARSMADEARLKVANGINLIEDRAAQRVRVKTFGELADQYLEENANQWGEKTAWQWKTDLTDKAQSIRNVSVNEVSHLHIAPLLKPIWTTTIETANRLFIDVFAQFWMKQLLRS